MKQISHAFGMNVLRNFDQGHHTATFISRPVL